MTRAARPSGTPALRIAAFSDFRVQDMPKTLELVKSLKPDVTLYAGDDVRRFGPLQTGTLERLLAENGHARVGIHACGSFPRAGPYRDRDGTAHPSGLYQARLPRTVCFNVKVEGKTSENLLEQKILDMARDPKIGEEFEFLRQARSRRPGKGAPKKTRIVFEQKNGRAYGIAHFPESGVDYAKEFAKASRLGFGGVIGNDDDLIHKSLLSGGGACDLHDGPLLAGGLCIVGQEGDALSENGGMGLTVYSEGEVEKHLDDLTSGRSLENVILVSHAPPAGVLDYAHRFGDRHVGSSAVRRFVADRQPLLVLCGHVHSHGGCVSRVGRTTVVNLASHDSPGSPGRVCLITVSGTNVDMEWFLVSADGVAEYSHRFVKDGGRLHSVLALHNVGIKTAEKMEAAGIRTLEDVLSAGEGGLVKLLNTSATHARKMSAQAKAVLDGRAVPQTKLEIPQKPLMFIDIETDLSQSYVWLISVCAEGGKGLKQFYAESPTREKAILKSFLEHRRKHGGHVLCYWSGAGFDERVIKCRLSQHRLDASGLGSWFDLCLAVKKSVVLPTGSFSLKSVAACVGYRYVHSDMDGFAAAKMYQDTVGSRKPALSKKLLEYGKDDILVLDSVVEKIGAMAGLSRDLESPEVLPASFEQECALLKDLRKRGMRVAEIAGIFGKGRDYVSTRLRQNPEAMKGRRVLLESGLVGRRRGSAGTITGQISPTVFEVKFGRKTLNVSMSSMKFA